MWEQREGRVRLPDGRWVQYLDVGPSGHGHFSWAISHVVIDIAAHLTQ